VKSLHSYRTCIPMIVGLLYPCCAYALDDTSLSKRLLQPQCNLIVASEMVLGYLQPVRWSSFVPPSYFYRSISVVSCPSSCRVQRTNEIYQPQSKATGSSVSSAVSILPCPSHAAALKAVGKQNSFVLLGACVSECTSNCFTFFSSNM